MIWEVGERLAEVHNLQGLTWSESGSGKVGIVARLGLGKRGGAGRGGEWKGRVRREDGKGRVCIRWVGWGGEEEYGVK